MSRLFLHSNMDSLPPLVKTIGQRSGDYTPCHVLMMCRVLVLVHEVYTSQDAHLTEACESQGSSACQSTIQSRHTDLMNKTPGLRPHRQSLYSDCLELHIYV